VPFYDLVLGCLLFVQKGHLRPNNKTKFLGAPFFILQNLSSPGSVYRQQGLQSGEVCLISVPSSEPGSILMYVKQLDMLDNRF
jgi:hypothetical protein